MAKRKDIAAARRYEGRREKMIETIGSGGQQAELYKTPSMFSGQYVYRLHHGGRNYYAPTQAAAHEMFRNLVLGSRVREAA